MKMASSLWLPAPTRTAPNPSSSASSTTTTTKSETAIVSSNQSANPIDNATAKPRKNRAPSYEQRCQAALTWRSLTPEERKQPKNKAPFVPRSIQDFDDGGAFPEIHVAQYPLHMGNPHLKKQFSSNNSNSKDGGAGTAVSGIVNSSALVNVEIDKDGQISYDAIVKQGTNSDKKVYTQHSDLKGGEADPDAIALPTSEQEQEVTNKTQNALLALLSKQNTLNKPTGSAMLNANTSQNQEANTKFISYQPNPDAPGYNPVAKQRVIQMVPAQLDPMMPPKHEHKKAPRGPAEDFVPVLHAPPTKLSKEEKAAWNIPACISNWKNTRGYTIPLDKRLAADGRGLREVSVNPNFATLSESLYVAERQAREEVRMRAKVQKQLQMAEKEKREADLRDLANQARLERNNISLNQQNNNPSENNPNASNLVPPDSVEENQSDDEEHNHKSNTDENYEDVSAAAQRERLRIARKKERERELRLEKAGKKQKLEDERDVSEQIALGVHTGTSSGMNQVDSRLYNQSAGLDSGFGAEDEYNTYSKPLFDRDAIAKNIYKPTQAANGGGLAMDAEEEYESLKQEGTSKFQPDRGFAGAEGGAPVSSGGGSRNAPVQFERSKRDA